MSRKRQIKVLAAVLCILAIIALPHRHDLLMFAKHWDDDNSDYFLDPVQLQSLYAKFRGIHYAASMGNIERIKALLEKDPELVNSRDWLLRTPLHVAIKNGRAQACYFLLEHGAKIDSKDIMGRDALDILEKVKNDISPMAYEGMHQEIWQNRYLEALLKSRELKEMINGQGGKGFRKAWDEIPELTQRDILQIDTRYDPNLLKIAAEKGDADLCSFFIHEGVEVYIAKDNTPSALFLASQKGHLEVVKTILAHGIDRKVTDSTRYNPLQIAYENQNYEIMRLLLQAGVSPNVQFKGGQTLLHSAIEAGKSEAANILIGHGAWVNAKDDPGNTPLHYALATGNVDVARSLTKAQANPAMVDTGYLLSEAANQGWVEIMKLILSWHDRRGPGKDVYTDINYRDPAGRTAAGAAAKAGQVDALQFLISKGADVNARDNDGNTLLHMAVASGNLEAVRLLLSQDVEVNDKDRLGLTALHFAAAKGSFEISKELIAHGAEIDTGPAMNSLWEDLSADTALTPFHLAVIFGRNDVIKLLLQEGTHSLESKFSYGDKDEDIVLKDFSPLDWTVYAGDTAVFQTLVNAGANVNTAGADAFYQDLKPIFSNFSPLLISFYKWDEQIAKTLIDHGANVNARDSEGRTPLLLACARKNLAGLKLLLSKGAPATAKDNEGRTALHLAAMSRTDAWTMEDEDMAIPRLLVAGGVKVNSRDREGRTALYLAAANSALPLVKFLLDHGALTNIRDVNGITPLQAAMSCDYCLLSEMLTLLVEHGADINVKDKDGETLLLKAAKANNPWDLDLLLANGANVRLKVSAFTFDGKTFKGSTFLHLAAAQYRSGLTSALLQAGYKVNARDSEGNTPLHMAAMFGSVDNLQTLLEAGADINVRNNSGQTILHIAVERDDTSSVACLMELHPDLNAKDKQGKTPLEIATEKKDQDMINVLKGDPTP